MSGRSELIELSRRALDGDESAIAGLRQADQVVFDSSQAVSDDQLLARAQDRINQIYEQTTPIDRPKSGFRAFHGSPYRFSQFEFEKIGTGEGAQAYGYGLYFADVEDVAKGYRDALTQPRIEVDGKPANLVYTNAIRERFADLYDEFIDNDFAVSFKSEYLDNLPEGANKQELESALDSLIEKVKQGDESPRDFELFTPEIDDAVQGATGISINDVYSIADNVVNLDNILSNMSQASTETELGYVLESLVGDERRFFEEYIRPRLSYVEPEGAMYEVQIGATKDQLLDWDRPVREQPEHIRNALLKIDGVDENTKGQFAYYLLARDATGLEAQKQATEAAKDLGIIGIKYNDGMSRGRDATDRPITNNYVIFDPRIIQISRQYGVSIPVAGMMLANQDAEAADVSSMRMDIVPPLRSPTFENDDSTGQALQARQDATLTPAQRARIRLGMEQPSQDQSLYERVPAQMERIAREYAIPAVKDIVGGFVEAPRQALAGFLDATAEAAEMMESIIPLGGEPIRIEADPRTVTGTGVRVISQFLTGFLPATRAVKAAGVTGIASPMIAGALTDATVFDPQEERLSNIIQEIPELENPITEYLAAGPDDTDAEGRLKNAIEGLGIGGVADGMVSGIRVLRARRGAIEAAEAEGKTIQQVAEEITPEDAPRMEEMLPGQEYIPFDRAAEQSQPTIAIRDFGVGGQRAAPEAAQNINLANLDTPADVDLLINQVAQADATPINAARREVITNEELPRLADELGMTVEDLLARRQGQAFNAEQILASRRILVASGENLIKLANAARTGSEMDLALFRRAMAQHRAIQAQVSGMTAEAGRALQSFRIVAQSSREQERAIREALTGSGGEQMSREMAEMLATLDSSEQVGRFVKDASTATTRDMLYEVWINGLLSSPTTHMVNVLSNTITAALAVGERKVASMIGGNIPPGEAGAQLKGMVDGARDGFRLAWNALKTGEPSDPLQKVEATKHRAISAEGLNISGTAGRFADYMGNAFRIPGRLLTAGDEFFKAVGYRMELYAQAYRQAFGEGLQGDAIARRVTEIIENPPENIRMAAVDASRYQTFTNELGPTGKAFENFRNNVPYARVIIPFVRTPTNIMSYTFERTPLAPLSKSFRDEIAAGGARRDLALGKLITGSMVMAATADMALSGHITGAGPTNREMQNVLRATGWQPYSIKVGDTYYAYNRLDPVGMMLGLAADTTEIIGQTDEATAAQLATAASLAIAQNMASKTYMSGISEFFDAFFSASTDTEANNYKLTRWLQRQASSAIPFSSFIGSIERSVNPELSATYGFIDQLKSRIPGYSNDLPPRRNIFGDPIVLDGGIGPDIVSPIYTSIDKADPVADEMVRQQIGITMPRRQIDGIELDANQYDRYIQLYSGIEADKTLRQQLRDTMRSTAYRNASDGPDGGKALMVKSIFTAYRDMARAQMIAEDRSLSRQIEVMQGSQLQQLQGR